MASVRQVQKWRSDDGPWRARVYCQDAAGSSWGDNFGDEQGADGFIARWSAECAALPSAPAAPAATPASTAADPTVVLSPPLFPTPTGAKTLAQMQAELRAAGWPFTTDDEAIQLYYQITSQGKGQPAPTLPIAVPAAPSGGSSAGGSAATGAGSAVGAGAGAAVGAGASQLGQVLGQTISLGGLRVPLWLAGGGLYLLLNRKRGRGLL